MKISIITVCYNSIKYLSQTIESVLNQTYEDIEYIIIDGGSTDGTIDLIKKYEPAFCGRMKWISEKDNGIYDAINKGIRMASGDLIGIINSDDWYEYNAIEQVVLNVKSVNSIIFGNTNFVDNDKITYGKPQTNYSDYAKKKGMPFCHQSVFIPKKLYCRLGCYDLNFKIVADYDFMYRCIQNNSEFIYIDVTISNFRLGGTSDKNYIKAILENSKVRLKNNSSYVVETFRVLNYIFKAVGYKFIKRLRE